MEENTKVESEISLMDIFSVLWKKIRLIVVLFLAGCTLGGVLGYLKSYNVTYYGTELTFFVSPKKDTDEDDKDVIYGTYGDTIMDSMVKLLSTEKSIGEYIEEIDEAPKKPVYEEGMDESVYAEQVFAYNKYVYKVKQSLEFTYKRSESGSSDTSLESKNFIYVTLSVREEGAFDKAFTAKLLAQLQVKIPKVVEESMLNPDKSQYAQTGCTLVTPLYPMVEVMNENYVVKETLKFIVLLGFAALIFTCAVIILLDRMDKRIRETDKIETRYRVPLLGLIPSISLESEEDQVGGETK